jgi:molybdopterin-guanine dinucleotide biosynthesis protein A
VPLQSKIPCALLILAGGQSSRMGRPKAWLPFQGQPMLARVLDRLAPLFEERIIVRAPGQELPAVEARLVEDEEPGQGPVAGLAVGLAAVTRPLAFALSCDAPFVNPDVVAYLVERCRPPHSVVVPLWEGRLQPLHAVYRTDTAPVLKQLLSAGRRRPVDLFREVPTLEVPEEEIRALDPDGLTFLNTNTPEEWQRALALAAEREPGQSIKFPSPEHRTPEDLNTIPVTVELLGLSRLTTRREFVELRVAPEGPLSRLITALAREVPALVGVAIDLEGDRLAPGYLLNRAGREPLLAEVVDLAPGDHLLLLSAEVGG